MNLDIKRKSSSVYLLPNCRDLQFTNRAKDAERGISHKSHIGQKQHWVLQYHLIEDFVHFIQRIMKIQCPHNECSVLLFAHLDNLQYLPRIPIAPYTYYFDLESKPALMLTETQKTQTNDLWVLPQKQAYQSPSLTSYYLRLCLTRTMTPSTVKNVGRWDRTRVSNHWHDDSTNRLLRSNPR